MARGRGIGHLVLGRPAGNPLRDDVLLVTESIARRAALAIDNARAHGALLATGQALQASLLPPSLPDVPGLEVGVVYEAAGEGAAAGGDFYDIFPVENGTWCFVVGDVCGTGAEAAAVTGLARHTIRSLTRAGFPVAPTLERLNSAILDEGERARFLTLVCGLFRHEGSRVQINLVNAGHPAPFVTGADAGVRRIGSPQLLLGVMDQVTYVPEEHVLERGELLVALTDGVLERRNGSLMLDDSGVATELATMGELPAQAVAERLRRLVVDFADSPQSDDIAILALRVGP
jgi:serine phosphatase RsbU (regulator of sigma subunit)